MRDNKQNRPLVTFVIAVRNAAKNLQRCFDSIYRQSLDSWEMVVIDGDSIDGTKAIIKINSDRIAFWVSEPDNGIYDAWNKALSHSSGEWVHFLGADDYLWNEYVLEKIAPLLSAGNRLDSIVYGQVKIMDNYDRVIQTEGRPWEEIKIKFLQGMTIPHQGVFHHSSLFEDRQFDVHFQYAGDYEFLLPEVLLRQPIFVEQVIAAWTHGGATSSPERALAILMEMRQARRKHNITSPIPLWQFTKGWVKFALWRLFGEGILHIAVDIYRYLTHRPPCYRNFKK